MPELRRDSIVLTCLYGSALLGFVTGHTTLVPAAYMHTVQDVSAVLGFAAGLLHASPLGPGSAKNMEPPKQEDPK